ncbi:MAG: GMC family oxidoreductase [Chloroflexi bacterium]|nr:GMC family oxidoreductase [Chloroflexota bacterium]MCI0727548.1 GMC family oxidoreductase [Chloroflexota bacterium]
MLADTGARIAVVEEGPVLATADFGDRVWPAFRRIYRQMGAQVTRGRAIIPILQGSCLGGSTVVNSAIVWRLPADVWQPWQTEYGLGEALPLDLLHHYWDQIEGELFTRPTPPEIWGENNRLLAVATQRLGLEGAPLRRNERGCQGSARCSLGCPHGAKQSMLVSYLPYAAERGATLFTSARVDRVILDGDRAVGVTGHFHRPQWQENIAPFTLRARQGVLVAASAVQTPGLLARSGVRSHHLGRHFQGHPGTSLVGVFDDEVTAWSGATQGYEVDHYRQNGRFKIETLALPPELLFPRLPGVGRAWVEKMAASAYMATWAVVLRAYAQGSVHDGRFGTQIRFDLAPQDVANLRRGLRLAAELLFAAGAREVLPGVHGLPESLANVDQARLLETGPDDPACYSLAMTHLFGTARMSLRPAEGVVGPDFAVHGTRAFYVIDSSLFPTNLGVNPQHTIMAIAMHAARRIAALH